MLKAIVQIHLCLILCIILFLCFRLSSSSLCFFSSSCCLLHSSSCFFLCSSSSLCLASSSFLLCSSSSLHFCSSSSLFLCSSSSCFFLFSAICFCHSSSSFCFCSCNCLFAFLFASRLAWRIVCALWKTSCCCFLSLSLFSLFSWSILNCFQANTANSSQVKLSGFFCKRMYSSGNFRSPSGFTVITEIRQFFCLAKVKIMYV